MKFFLLKVYEKNFAQPALLLLQQRLRTQTKVSGVVVDKQSSQFHS
jgi:hypothetical protein